MFGYVPRPPAGLARRAFHRLFGPPNFLRRLQWPSIRELLALEPEHVVLDVGCGDAQVSAELSKQPLRAVLAIDALPRLATLGYLARTLPRLRVVRGDAMRLPLADRSVDRILASSLVQMLPDPVGLLKECRRVLKPGGILVLTVPEMYCYLPNDQRFLGRINRFFGVDGLGYVEEPELTSMLRDAGFTPGQRLRVPGPFGTLIWEASVATSERLGTRLPMLLSFAFYPLARWGVGSPKRGAGCELLMSAVAV